MRAYRENDGIRRAYAEDLCWHIAMRDGQEVWFPPVGDWNGKDWADIFNRCVPSGTQFTYVPEPLVQAWQESMPDRIAITERRDDWDYVLDTHRMSNMGGKTYSRIRVKVHRFERDFVHSLEGITSDNLSDMLAFHRQAEDEVMNDNGNPEEAIAENKAFNYTVEHWGENDRLFGILLRVDGKVVGYFIDELMPDGRSVCIYAKADYSYTGITSFLYHKDALMETEHGVNTVNIMSDVGVINMRNAKNDLRPSKMIVKYDVKVL
ncbi:MAG: DUF2156 domain-containing protein [Lachnospiraceae bacterium]|nr:DUF2156 domain-containing protein [Lachnospiraceae bacterium]